MRRSKNQIARDLSIQYDRQIIPVPGGWNLVVDNTGGTKFYYTKDELIRAIDRGEGVTSVLPRAYQKTFELIMEDAHV